MPSSWQTSKAAEHNELEHDEARNIVQSLLKLKLHWVWTTVINVFFH